MNTETLSLLRTLLTTTLKGCARTVISADFKDGKIVGFSIETWQHVHTYNWTANLVSDSLPAYLTIESVDESQILINTNDEFSSTREEVQSTMLALFKEVLLLSNSEGWNWSISINSCEDSIGIGVTKPGYYPRIDSDNSKDYICRDCHEENCICDDSCPGCGKLSCKCDPEDMFFVPMQG